MDMLQAAIMRARSDKAVVRFRNPPETRPILSEPPPLRSNPAITGQIRPPVVKSDQKPIPEAVRIYRAPVGDVAKIQQAVVEYYKLSMIDLKSDRRYFDVVTARHVAMWLAKELTFRSLPEIGRIFRRDHTSVLHGIRSVNERMKSDSLPITQLTPHGTKYRQSRP